MSELSRGQRRERRRLISAGVAGLMAAAVGTSGATTNFWGASGGHSRSKAEQSAIAHASFYDWLRRASSADRFTMMYNGTTSINVRGGRPGKGILGWLNDGASSHHQITFGQPCLSNSPYYTPLSVVTGSVGDFVSGHVEDKSYMPAGFIFDPADPDRLKVVSGNPQLPILEFIGLKAGAELTPATPATIGQLATYSCAEGIPVSSSS